MMARAHLLKTITDSAGNALAGASVRVLRPGTTTPVSETLYSQDVGSATLSNPFTTLTGMVSIYAANPMRVTLGVTVGANPEVFFPDVDILEPAEGDFQTAAQTPYTSPNVAITADNVQDALDQIYLAAGGTQTHAGDGFESTQVGPGAVAASDQTTALGHQADASTFQASALGEGTVASGTGATAVGQSADATANQTTAVGTDAQASAIGATSVGVEADAAGADSTALGHQAQTTGARSTAVGHGAVAANPDEFVARGDILVVQPSSPSGHATTVQVSAADDSAHTFGASATGPLFDGAPLAAEDIAYTPAGTVAATDVQAAVQEVAGEAATATATVATDLASHLADTTDAHDASAISYVPTGSVAATDVQGAISELATEKYGPDNAPPETFYLQTQLVTGNVAVGTHVLKPGLRVPNANTLREVVLRIDTAPVGAPVTVEVERFNGGVSQGVIATVTIADGAFVGSAVGLSAACLKGDMLRFNVTSVGSTTPGADLTASLDFH